MEWTQSDIDALRKLKSNIDSDDIKIKEKIKEVLLENKYITHVLNNKELENSGAEPDDYFGINILPYYLVSNTQTDVQNYLCFEVSYDELDRYNSSVKLLNIIFYILCEQKSIIDEDTGIARHDLLAALVQDQFNYTNYFGKTIALKSDKPGVVDQNHVSRTLIFEQITDNNLVKTKNGYARLSNKGA